MEQAVSAAIANKGMIIPKDHPAKVTNFINIYDLRDSEIDILLSSWIGKRGKSQYVDIRRGKLFIPHEIFDEWDAEKALKDAKRIINFVTKIVNVN